MSTAIKIDTPNPKQAEFLKCTKRYVGFGGARGGGKSWAVRTKAKLLAFRYPGIRILIVRKSYPELRENHINILRMELADIAKYNDNEKCLKFPNGSTIKFDYCNTDSDLTHYQGTEYDVIFFDEATNFTEYQLKIIMATNRGINDFPKRIYFTCNPGGPGHAFIKRIFVDKVYVGDENPDDYAFIQSLVWDNEILLKNNPDYINMLKSLPEEKRKGWLEGQWDIFEGMVFSEFRNNEQHYDDRQWTHVVRPFKIPSTFKIYRCMDWGYSRPFAIYWVAVGQQKEKYVIREFYGCTGEPNKGLQLQHMAVAEQAHEIEMTDPIFQGHKIYAGPADPAIFSKDSHGVTIQGDMAKAPNYILFTRGNNDRINGKMQVHYHLAFNEQGYPMMQIFNTCKHLIRTLPSLMYDEHKIEDVDTEMEDHGYDAIRYMLAEFHIAPRQSAPIQIPEFDPLNQFHKEDTTFKYYNI